MAPRNPSHRHRPHPHRRLLLRSQQQMPAAADMGAPGGGYMHDAAGYPQPRYEHEILWGYLMKTRACVFL